ncbi:hypothetical protein ACFWDI_40580 [Streptomyces sp. NPDC060064]|uniref:hypothetical protein n=1 Tax=Streptomyces sp. NPDC060064 TaxID=3347049 RepID=UPI00367442A9
MEVDPDPGGQGPQPSLNRPGLLKHGIDQLERDVLGQLTEASGAKTPLATVVVRVRVVMAD